jgi:hypothetical protein
MTYKVTVVVEDPDGNAITSTTEYDALPTLLAIEDALDLELEMTSNYGRWRALFLGSEFNILTARGPT